MIGEVQALRLQVADLIKKKESQAALAVLRELWNRQSTTATASFVLSSFAQIKHDLALTPVRVAVLRSFTVEPAVVLCKAAAALAAIDVEFHLGEFNAYMQEGLDAESSLYRFNPDVVILAVQTRDIAPALWNEFADLPVEAAESVRRGVLGSVETLLQAIRSRSQAHVVIHSMEKAPEPAHGLLDSQIPAGQNRFIEKINAELTQMASRYAGVYLLDYDGLIAKHGRYRWHDPQKWISMRMPISADCLIHLATEWLKMMHPLCGRVCKALVCDLDNTLWGGVIGEDGLDGLKLDNEYPGAAYRDFQRAILDLYRRGIILAICSKNNPNEAMEVLTSHPHMLLRPEHFAAIKINWTDKAKNLQDIARELNIGIDSLALVDDSPTERAFVRAMLPQVTVIDLPEDPFQYAATLRAAPVFERLVLSEEDRDRGAMYAQERQRDNLQQATASLEDFYQSLKMKMEIAAVNGRSLARVAQLTQKTNQFNLTTKRYSEQQIAEFIASPAMRVLSVRVTDRFGDSGIVGVVITRQLGADCEIDTFLMSCRVIGRTVETAMLATVAAEAKSAGASRLIGWYRPTQKNAPCRDFFSKHHFAFTSEGGEGARWELDLDRKLPVAPSWIDRNIATGGSTCQM